MLNIPASAKSWIDVPADSHFPIQNLPIGLACMEGDTESLVSRIGDQVIDICALAAEGLIPESEFPITHSLIDCDQASIRRLRSYLYELFREDNPTLRDHHEAHECVLFAAENVEMLVPMEIPQFVDFYSGINHASNVGKMFRPDMAALLPNYRHLPVGYNGRASTVYPSGKAIRRPKGQTKAADADLPTFGPTKELDFELELGFFIAEGNEEGEMISPNLANEHMLGLVLVNDWSARDVQRWEYQPLGPFLAKSFATTISPWIVSLDALEPFRVEGQSQEPQPLPHLARGQKDHFDIVLEVSLQTAKMTQPQVICRSNAKHLYWSLAQMLAHQTSNGTKVQSGDLYASGTISGEDEDSFGSLLELSWKGSKPLTMTETDEQRTFLEDGDTVIFTGYCQGEGYRIGFGELRNTVSG